MSVEARQLSAEQQEENARQRKVSFLFMQKYLDDFVPNAFNASLINTYIKARSLPWELESLEEAHKFCEPGYDLTPAPEPAPPAPETPAPDPNAAPYGDITKDRIRKMDRTEMASWVRHPVWGKQFIQAVNALKIERKDLSK